MVTNQITVGGLIGFLIRLVAGISIVLIVTVPIVQVQSQGSFNSGSTGADGAFNPTANQTLILPPDGVFNYTTVNVPAGVTITYIRNAKNTPVIILATGDVVINGEINVDGVSATSYLAGGAGGPGGFDGGRGATGIGADINGYHGMGPGGGVGGQSGLSTYSYGNGGGGGFAQPGGVGGKLYEGIGGAGGVNYGTVTLIPLIGGSGGGGGSTILNTSTYGGSGGGGGGAIIIASSSTISGGGHIKARGGKYSCGPSPTCCISSCGGYGAGGAIRLIANIITGGLNLWAGGVLDNFNGGPGYVRVESNNLTTFNPNVSPGNAVFTIGTPNPITVSNQPTLSIISVAGIPSPVNPAGTFNGPTDITIPSVQTSPVAVSIAATNIPVGTTVQVSVTPETGSITNTPSTPLAGTLASSTATADVTLPSGVSLITATTTVDLTLMSQVKPIFINGEKVRKMEIAASYGGKSEITYITESGKRVKRPGDQ